MTATSFWGNRISVLKVSDDDLAALSSVAKVPGQSQVTGDTRAFNYKQRTVFTD